MNHCGQNFHFFNWVLFSQNFWMELKRRPLSIRQGSKFSSIRLFESIIKNEFMEHWKDINIFKDSQYNMDSERKVVTL